MDCGLSRSYFISFLVLLMFCFASQNVFAGQDDGLASDDAFDEVQHSESDDEDAISYNDESNDISIVPAAKTKKSANPMKFRGNVMIGGYYYFAQPIGVALGDVPHIGKNSYSTLDYTNDGDPHNEHHNDGIGYKVGSTWGGLEGKLFVSYAAIAPFLQTDNVLFRDNNISVSLDGELTPVTISQGISVKITPIAFLTFLAGCKIGSGWNFFGIFNGMGINDGSCVKGKVQPFYSACFHSWFRATFQFDIAAVMPSKYKRWTHIQMLAAAQLRYKALLNTPSEVSFQYEADRGENLAGWRFEGTFVLGYKVPIIIDETGRDEMFLKRRNNNFAILAAMMVDIDRMDLSHADISPMSQGGFGSDFCYVYFGPTLMFDLPNNMIAAFGLHWANDKEYTAETVGNIYYQDRVYKDWYVYFARILISVGWNF